MDGGPAQLAVVRDLGEGADGNSLTEEISARTPTRDERRLLQLVDGSPVIALRRTLLHDDEPVEVADIVLTSGRCGHTYVISARLE